MDKLNKLTVPAGEQFRKLQKMVHDIKKNESGIINKFKKFQNEQVALICKTGKDTWDRYAISELHNAMTGCLDTDPCSVLCMLSF